MHTWRQSWWSGNHNLHWLAHPSHSAPRIRPRTCRQQWKSSCPKGQFEPLFHPETKGFLSHLFPGVKEERGSVSYHRSLLLESPSGHSTDQDGNPGISQVATKRANGLCLLTYRTHICTSPWQLLYRNTSSSWSTVQCTNSARPPPLDNLPRWIKLHVYLDYWLICTSTPVQARTRANLVLRVLQHLSWVINFSKSDLSPSQWFNFISMQFKYVHQYSGTSAQNGSWCHASSVV